MIPLPIDDHLEEILAQVRQHRRIVLSAPPGSGKTTRVAPRILTAGLLSAEYPNLVMLQPRRVAARASAARIAQENGWTLGGEVGYHIRNEKRVGPRTRLRVATEGILTRQLVADPFLQGVGAVVLDEFHERSLHTDLSLTLLREAADSVREDMILIVMSATVDSAPIARYLGGCPVITVPGRLFPIEIEYQEGHDARSLPDRVSLAVSRVLNSDDRGDMLVFLPGVEEIRRSERALAPMASSHDLLVLPLHGSLPSGEQDRALRPSDRRKVVLATNVAETSLTIEGITTVIDSGLARQAHHDAARGLDRLELGWISRASATQRAGRAGRTGPGRCLRLWPERENRGRAEFDVPEIRRLDLSTTILEVKSWGCTDPTSLGWFEPPPVESVEAAERTLRMLGATSANGMLTEIGRDLLRLPVHPRIGRLLSAAAVGGRVDEGAGLAALLSERDILSATGSAGSPRETHHRGECDLFSRLDLLDEARRDRFSPRLRDRGIDPIAARRVASVEEDLLRVAKRLDVEGQDPGGEDSLRFWLLLAYPDRVCKRREPGSDRAVMVGGRGVRLDPGSVVKEAAFFLALDPRETKRSEKREALVRLACAIEVEWLGHAFPDAMKAERSVFYDETRGRSVAITTTLYHDLPLREDPHGSLTDRQAEQALADWLTPRAMAYLRENEETSRWLDRYEFLRAEIPDLDLPEFTPESLQEVVAAMCQHKRSLSEVRRVPAIPLLKSLLSFHQAQTFEKEAPESIQVPTGNKIRLAYEPGRPPVLAVRLQEMFGVAETPRVASGRVPVLLHLLGPNYRPVQVTNDLRSFWTTTYFQVRKDLRNRYPKHSWPEDPWTARPEAKGKRSS